ncbi:hypothetical protein JZU61_04340 [bacterium]|jgi:hypothetical protein|nr:hypothetical protein [bacterium]
MAKIFEIEPIFCDEIPENLEEGKLYVSEKFGIANHLCACGCGQQTVTGLKPYWDDGWTISRNIGLITLRPSIGNFKWENPYHAHYYITDNKIDWL